MKEFRLTFAAEDFAAVSQALVAMGVSFHVEPVGIGPAEGPVAEAEAPATARVVRGAVKGARKASPTRQAKHSRAAKAETPALPANAPTGGADRLREAIARSGSAYRSVMEPPKAADETQSMSPSSAETGNVGSS